MKEYLHKVYTRGHYVTKLYYKPVGSRLWVSMRIAQSSDWLKKKRITTIEHNQELPKENIRVMGVDDYDKYILKHLDFVDALY